MFILCLHYNAAYYDLVKQIAHVVRNFHCTINNSWNSPEYYGREIVNNYIKWMWIIMGTYK